MRETIAETLKTVEETQTTQAMHGLLSLKENEGGAGDKAPAPKSTYVKIASKDMDITMCPESSGSASETLTKAARQATAAAQPITDQHMQKSLEQARICNSEVQNVSLKLLFDL